MTSVCISDTVNEMSPVSSLTQLYLGAAGGGISKAKVVQCCWIPALCEVSATQKPSLGLMLRFLLTSPGNVAVHCSAQVRCQVTAAVSPGCGWECTDSSETSCIPADFTA